MRGKKIPSDYFSSFHWHLSERHNEYFNVEFSRVENCDTQWKINTKCQLCAFFKCFSINDITARRSYKHKLGFVNREFPDTPINNCKQVQAEIQWLTSLRWSKSALLPIKYADGPFCSDFKLPKARVAYLKLSRSVILYTIKHESAHWICSIGNSLSVSADTSTISTSSSPLSNEIVWRYNKSVFDRYSPMYLRVK